MWENIINVIFDNYQFQLDWALMQLFGNNCDISELILIHILGHTWIYSVLNMTMAPACIAYKTMMCSGLATDSLGVGYKSSEFGLIKLQSTKLLHI